MATLSTSSSSATRAKQHVEAGFQPLEWEETSYTKIPRGFRRETANFLRFIGLGILVTTFQGAVQSNFSEPKKVAVYRSRVSALLRALIHVLPMGFALLEVIVNLRGHYLGGTFDKQSVYQLAAKAHEIAVNASLASIVITFIRHELTTGDGLPFGAFLGTLHFSSVSYLWSPELFSSLFATGSKLRRTLFFLLILICGIISATVGPSSATLLIPRQLLWPVSPSYVLINGTFQDIWPDRTETSRISSNCSIMSPSSAQTESPDTLCPASFWESIVIQDSVATNTEARASPSLLGLEGFFWALPILSGDVYLSGSLGTCPFNRSSPQICGVGETFIVATAAFNDAFSYTANNDITSYTDILHSVSKNFYAATAAVHCSHDTITSPGDKDVVRFPGLLRTEQQYADSTELIARDGLTKAEVYAMSSNSSAFTLVWTDLPEEQFGESTSGAILIEPRSPVPGSPQNISTCTLAAGWGTSKMEEDLYAADFYTSPYNVPAAFQKIFKSDKQGDVTGIVSYAPIFGNISGSAYPQRPITMPVEWLQYLNPTILFPDGTNTSVINEYMSTYPERLSAFGLAQLITQMLTVGLSTIGADLPWQQLPDGPVQCDNCQIFQVDHSYSGWAYTSSGTPVKLAISVMIIYCVLALAHTIYIVGVGISSDSWDSAAEVVALAMNSAPTQHLRNTCAGVYGMKIFRTIVRVVATSSDSGEKDHLELVFGDNLVAKEAQIKVKFNEEYGSYPRMVVGKKMD